MPTNTHSSNNYTCELIQTRTPLDRLDQDQTTAATVLAENGEGMSVIAGGAARAVYNSDAPYDDLDIFMTQHVSSTRDVEVRMKELNYAVSYERGVPTFRKDGSKPIQIITFRAFNDVNNILATFDFTVCQFAFTKNFMWHTQQAVDDVESKTLRFTDFAINDPYNLEKRYWRVKKYLAKGYKFAPGHAELFFTKMRWSGKDEATAIAQTGSSHPSTFGGATIGHALPDAMPMDAVSSFDELRVHSGVTSVPMGIGRSSGSISRGVIDNTVPSSERWVVSGGNGRVVDTIHPYPNDDFHRIHQGLAEHENARRAEYEASLARLAGMTPTISDIDRMRAELDTYASGQQQGSAASQEANAPGFFSRLFG